MISLIQKGYEILEEPILSKPFSIKEVIQLDDPYWKLSMHVWEKHSENFFLNNKNNFILDLLKMFDDEHTGINYFGTTQYYTDGYVQMHQDRGSFSLVTGESRKFQIFDGDWIDAQHVIILGKYGAKHLGSVAPYHRVLPSTGFSHTLQVAPDHLTDLWTLPDEEATNSYRHGAKCDQGTD